jgi:hypothetical protein
MCISMNGTCSCKCIWKTDWSLLNNFFIEYL